MQFNVPAYSLVFYAGLILAVILAVLVLKRRPAPGAFPFALFILSGAVWSFFWILELSSIQLSDKILWAKMEYLGILSSGVLWFCFTLDYTGSTRWRSFRPILLLAIIPVLTWLIVLTNQWHAWFWSNIYVSDTSLGPVTVWDHGFWFWISAAYQYAPVFAGIVVLLRYNARRNQLYRKQIILLTLGALSPIIVNLIYVMGVRAGAGLDFTPASIAVSALIYTYTIFRYHLLDVSAVARNALVERLPDALLALNAEGRIVDMNPAAQITGGFSKKAAADQFLAQVWPELGSFTGGLDRGRHAEMTIAVSGTKHYFDVNATDLFDDRGVIGGKLIVLRDVTEQHLMYAEDQRLRGRLMEEIDNRSKYTRALVHELKTPLTAILSSSELLQWKVPDNILSALVENIRQASLNLELRTNEIIDLACGEIGMLSVECRPLDLSQIILETMDNLRPSASIKGLSLSAEVEDPPLIVQGDIKRLQLVFNSLLANAIKFTDLGSIVIRAKDFDHETVLVQILDTGRGIDQKRLKNLFDPYRRNYTEGQQYGGLGIGLALSKLYVELQKGQIWVESKPGEGAIFSFTIPLCREGASTLLAAIPCAAVQSPQPSP